MFYLHVVLARKWFIIIVTTEDKYEVMLNSDITVTVLDFEIHFKS